MSDPRRFVAGGLGLVLQAGDAVLQGEPVEVGVHHPQHRVQMTEHAGTGLLRDARLEIGNQGLEDLRLGPDRGSILGGDTLQRAPADPLAEVCRRRTAVFWRPMSSGADIVENTPVAHRSFPGEPIGSRPIGHRHGAQPALVAAPAHRLRPPDQLPLRPPDRLPLRRRFGRWASRTPVTRSSRIRCACASSVPE